jgi:hypothetical protein
MSSEPNGFLSSKDCSWKEVESHSIESVERLKETYFEIHRSENEVCILDQPFHALLYLCHVVVKTVERFNLLSGFGNQTTD